MNITITGLRRHGAQRNEITNRYSPNATIEDVLANVSAYVEYPRTGREYQLVINVNGQTLRAKRSKTLREADDYLQKEYGRRLHRLELVDLRPNNKRVNRESRVFSPRLVSPRSRSPSPRSPRSPVSLQSPRSRSPSPRSPPRSPRLLMGGNHLYEKNHRVSFGRVTRR